MKKSFNISIENKSFHILADLFYKENNNGKLIVFCHGFKGFKDWGPWNLVAEEFAKAGFIFLKFNFSHNGIGQEDLQSFTRLDLFEENNYSKEMDDLKCLLNWVGSQAYEEKNLPNFKEVFIIGHSRGGGIALLSAFENHKIGKVATWASIANFDRFGNQENIEAWKQEGTKNFYNSRTKQDMKIAYQFYEDYDANRSRFDLEQVCQQMKKPQLIIHGKNDEAVGFSHAQRLKNWNTNSELVLIEDANHVFGSQHPYVNEGLPQHLKEAVAQTIDFFNRK